VLLALLMFVGIYIGMKEGNWWGVLLCTGFLAMLAQFYDVFRMEALREKMPHGSFAPNKKVQVLLFLYLGVGAIVGGVARLWIGSYWDGAGLLSIGLIVLSGAINVFRGRT
jgi:hypothetical protein